MRTSHVWIVGLAIVAALFFGYLYLHHRTYQRVGMYNAKCFLERAYPECVGVFLFDCSSAHEAFSSDALRASMAARRSG